MSTIALAPVSVNPTPSLAPAFISTGCLRPVPCDQAGYTYRSQYCAACFARFIARFDHYLSPEPEPAPVYTGPTALESYIPSADEEAERLALVAELADREALMAEWAEADRLETLATAFGDPWDLLNPAEIVECGGYHPAGRYA